MRELKNKKDNYTGSVALASYTRIRIKSGHQGAGQRNLFLASHTHVRVESIVRKPPVTISLLTRMYELKKPVRNPLILNASRPSSREPIIFILYILVFK